MVNIGKRLLSFVANCLPKKQAYSPPKLLLTEERSTVSVMHRKNTLAEVRCQSSLTILFVLVAMSLTACQTNIGHYQYDPSWPKNTGLYPWGFDESGDVFAGVVKGTAGVSVDRENSLVYVLARTAPNVRVFREDGSFVRDWSPEEVGRMHMVHVDSSGNLWIADTHLHTVTQYTPTGEVLLTLGTPGEPGMDEKHFNKPTDITSTEDGSTIFVSDGYANNRVVKFDGKGAYLGMWGGEQPGVNNGEFRLPHSITLSGKRVYVADRSGARIQVFDLDGRFIEDWRDIIIPWGIANYEGFIVVAGQKIPKGQTTLGITREKLYGPLVSGPTGQDIMIFDTEGEVVSETQLIQGRELGQVDWLHGIDVGANGDIYLTDVVGNHVQRWKNNAAK